MTNDEAKRIIEALLFASDKPVGVNEMAQVLEDIGSTVIRDLVMDLKSEYESQNRSFTITEVAGGFQLVTDAYYALWIKKLFGGDRPQKLSMPSLETLAIIAYKQPLTRSEIEVIRGVNIDGVIENLLEKNLIRTSGRKEAPGRPFVYSTTEEFLIHFGLRSLEDLPRLKEFTEKDIQAGERPGVVIENKETAGAKKEEITDGAGETAKTN